MGIVLLVGLGSSGDVNPLLGLAEGFRERQHDVTLISAPPFAEAARRVGVAFAPIGTLESFERVYADPRLWHPRRGLGVFFRYVASLTGETVERIRERFRPGETVVLSTFQCFGARVAQEALGVPVATVLPNPILLQSVHDPNRNPLANPPRWMGATGIRWMYRVTNWEVSRHARKGVNEVRRAFGLAPVRDVVAWSYSPLRVLGLWPALLSSRQPDWPPQAKTTGFITYDGPEAKTWAPPPHLRDGRDWLVFTPGSQMTHGRFFFEAAAEAAERLGVPTLMVVKDASVLPPSLPDQVHHVAYAPFAWLFERAVAVVHHGGIGTAGRALQAGVPQLVVPSGFDQFDNAERVARLGAGKLLETRHANGVRMADSIRALIEGPTFRRRCAEISRQLAQVNALRQTCLAVEELLESPSVSV